MHLAQHHFQLQSAYFEQTAGAAMSNLFAAPYGMLGVEFDESALLNDSVVIASAWGILPDGTPFSFPDEPTPQPLLLTQAFSPTRSSHVVLLAIPSEQPGRANCDLAGGNGAPSTAFRFSVAERLMPDETTGSDPRPVQLARKNFRLMLDTDVTDGMVTMPIARVQRDGAGHFTFDNRWAGPCLRISASPRLRDLVGRLVQMLEQRSAAMVAERTASAGAAEYAPREVVSFWFAHALNTAIPALKHHHRTGLAHPEQLYLLLAQLAGALCTFSLTSTPRDLPDYDHDSPEESFAAVEHHIREHLDVMLPPDAVVLAIRSVEPWFYAAAITDPRCLEPTAHWYLGIRSSAPASKVIGETPGLVKVCAAKHIRNLVRSAFAGLSIEHIPTPPADLSPRLGTHYFAVRRGGSGVARDSSGPNAPELCWKYIVDTREVGLYVPAALPDLELELKVVMSRSETEPIR